MSEENKTIDSSTPQSDNSAEVNFAKLRKKLEATEKEREELRAHSLQLEKEKEDLLKSKSRPLEDDDDDEPYVDKRKLKKELSRYGEEFERKVEDKVQRALEQERKNTYLKENSDFDQVMAPESLQKFVEAHPSLAEAILKMPDGFERQKLVYENLKTLQRFKEASSKPSIQDKIDSNRRSPYYQGPSNATPPFGGQIDPKAAYNKMQELKSRLRLG